VIDETQFGHNLFPHKENVNLHVFWCGHDAPDYEQLTQHSCGHQE